MKTEGYIEPTDAMSVRTAYEQVRPMAKTIVSTVAKAMGFGRSEYDDRVTTEVYTAATNALFASLLTVHHGSIEEFEEWCTAIEEDLSIHRIGSDTVDRIVWHRFDSTVVAATYQNEPVAARGTLQRVAFDRCYRELVTDIDD